MKQGKKYGAFAGNARVGGKLGLQAGSQDAGEVLESLCKVQATEGAVSAPDIDRIASKTSTSEAAVRGACSFYSLLESGTADQPRKDVVRVCDGPACRLAGSDPLCRSRAEGDSIRVARTSCLGYCDQAPSVMVDRSTGERFIAGSVNELSTDIGSLGNRNPMVHVLGHPTPDLSRRPLTRRFGLNPLSIDAALAAGAYRGLLVALHTESERIIRDVDDSGLRGRGGAGFRTGQKWRLAAEATGDQKYVVCNADESEPGTFKDRALMEADPHLLLEGMAICARAIGATKGVIYIRGAYTRAANVLRQAIEQARERNYLGGDIQGSGFEFDVAIHCGAGAYICGEETALLESLEGKRGEPRERPPYPATCGLWGKPTVVNNVETLCSVPAIVQSGPAEYRQLGRGRACGTKLYCLSGHVTHAGICEAPKGISVRQLLQEFGGGMRSGSEFKFALTGGAAGTFLPESLLDSELTYDALESGVALGSGAIVVADESVNAAEMLLGLLDFFARESCGKCTPCRVGVVQARDVVAKIVSGNGDAEDLRRLEELAETLQTMSLCGLGMSVAWPIESALRHFPRDFLA